MWPCRLTVGLPAHDAQAPVSYLQPGTRRKQSKCPHEAAHDGRVEFLAAHAVHKSHGIVRRHRGCIAPILEHGVVGIHESRKPGWERNLGAAQAAGIAAAVEALVMHEDRVFHRFRNRRRRADHVQAAADVAFHKATLMTSQGFGLGQNCDGHRELADVEQKAGECQFANQWVLKTDAPAGESHQNRGTEGPPIEKGHLEFGGQQPGDRVRVRQQTGDYRIEHAPQRCQQQVFGAPHALHGHCKRMAQSAQFRALASQWRRQVTRRQRSHLPGQAGVKHLIVRVLGKHRIHVDVIADAPKLVDLLALAEQESVGMERGLQPRPIQFGHIHAELKLSTVHGY